MRISNQNQRTQVASDKTDEASTTGEVKKGAERKTALAGRTGDSFEIAKSPSAFDQLIALDGRAAFGKQRVDLSLRDPNDDAAANPSLDASDPRGDLERVTLERETIVDVAGSMPAGHTLEQSLPTGLDGKPLPTGPHHLGMDQAEKDLDGRSDSTSPNKMLRDPKASFAPARPGTGRGDHTKNTPGPKSGPDVEGGAKSGGTHATPPPGTKLSFRAPNRDLVSNGDRKNSTKGELDGLFSGKAPEKAKETPEEKFKRESGQDDKQDKPLKEYEEKKKNVNPDADPGAGTGTQTLTEDEVARMVTKRRGNVDFVEGYGGGPQIEGDKPPVRYRDLVTNPNPDDPGSADVSTATGTVTPPGQEISKPVNPNDGLGPELPQPGGGAGPSNDGDS